MFRPFALCVEDVFVQKFKPEHLLYRGKCFAHPVDTFAPENCACSALLHPSTHSPVCLCGNVLLDQWRAECLVSGLFMHSNTTWQTVAILSFYCIIFFSPSRATSIYVQLLHNVITTLLMIYSWGLFRLRELGVLNQRRIFHLPSCGGCQENSQANEIATLGQNYHITEGEEKRGRE